MVVKGKDNTRVGLTKGKPSFQQSVQTLPPAFRRKDPNTQLGLAEVPPLCPVAQVLSCNLGVYFIRYDKIRIFGTYAFLKDNIQRGGHKVLIQLLNTYGYSFYVI